MQPVAEEWVPVPVPVPGWQLIRGRLLEGWDTSTHTTHTPYTTHTGTGTSTGTHSSATGCAHRSRAVKPLLEVLGD